MQQTVYVGSTSSLVLAAANNTGTVVFSNTGTIPVYLQFNVDAALDSGPSVGPNGGTYKVPLNGVDVYAIQAGSGFIQVLIDITPFDENNILDLLKIGACFGTASNFPTVDGENTPMPMDISASSWLTGMAVNDTNDGLVFLVKGRYHVVCGFDFFADAANDIDWSSFCGGVQTVGLIRTVVADPATKEWTFNYSGYLEANVGDVLQFFIRSAGADSDIFAAVLTIQYVGPAVSI